MQKGCVIVGYQGIGKSSVAEKDDRFIDLESSLFFISKNSRYDSWYLPYARIARYLARKGFIVFVSSHKEVRDVLQNFDVKTYVCYPSLNLEEEWLKRLQSRWVSSGLNKDFKAWKNTEEKFKENILSLKSSPFEQIEITTLNYNLKDLIENRLNN